MFQFYVEHPLFKKLFVDIGLSLGNLGSKCADCGFADLSDVMTLLCLKPGVGIDVGVPRLPVAEINRRDQLAAQGIKSPEGAWGPLSDDE